MCVRMHVCVSAFFGGILVKWGDMSSPHPTQVRRQQRQEMKEEMKLGRGIERIGVFVVMLQGTK